MILCYSGRSAPSAEAIALADDVGDIRIVRHGDGDINWGRARANTSLNPDISNVTNKRIMRELFAEHDVPMPRLIDSAEVYYAVNNGKVLVGRPDQHTKGRGLWICSNVLDVRKALHGTRRKKAATHFMEFVENEREYRVHILQGKSIRISEKVFTDDSRKCYTTGKPGEIKLAKVREAAKAAVAAVGLDFGAVDILASGADNSDVWVLEVNAAPGLGGSMPKLYADTFKKWWSEQ